MAFFLRKALPLVAYVPFLKTCLVIDKPAMLKAFWATSSEFDLFIFVLVCFNALSRPREQHVKLTYVLYRDGIIFFVVISGMNAGV